MTPANMVFGRELLLPCDLLFGAPPDKEESTTDYAVNLAERLRDIHHFDRQNLKKASDRMKARFDGLAISPVFQDGDRVWMYYPTRRRRSSKLQSFWEGPYIVTRINDVVYWVQRNPRAKMMVVHLDRLAPCLGATRDE
jgi:hypothetical protein